MTLNAHREALDFYKANNLIPKIAPLSVVQLAIEHGYGLAVDQVTAKLKSVSAELKIKQANSK